MQLSNIVVRFEQKPPFYRFYAEGLAGFYLSGDKPKLERLIMSITPLAQNLFYLNQNLWVSPWDTLDFERLLNSGQVRVAFQHIDPTPIEKLDLLDALPKIFIEGYFGKDNREIRFIPHEAPLDQALIKRIGAA